ncbi:MAG: transposase family protein [Proteobacteria bacterium]|nr:transposase family protein [Pseudomonadota bacterium]
MTPTEIRAAVRGLQMQGHSLREISRLLAMSRNTVRRILREPAGDAGEVLACDEATLVRLKGAFARARGNVVRVRELLADDGLKVPYSTLTRWVRDADLRGPPRRAGEYTFAPGQEMQHDTSPHRVRFGQTDTPVTMQCAGLVLAYSRRLFIQYYPRFTRFEARAFLLEAARFMAGVCPVCIIDNTSVLLAAGAGADAVIAPEMAAFARTLGFGFRAHRVGNPDRKGRIERPFAYVETNFLVGRTFADIDDLNGQALDWCHGTANRKPKQALGMSPEAAYVIEQPHLSPLPDVLPPVYELLERVIDLHGYVSVDTNRYSVPERYVGKSVTVTKTPAQIEVRRKSTTIATHRRVIGQRDTRNTLPGHHTIPVRQNRGTAAEEALLCGHHDSLDRYTAALRQHGRAGNRRALRRLIEMQRTYPSGPFIAAIEQALRYGLFDLSRLEDLVLKQVGGDFFALNTTQPDDA